MPNNEPEGTLTGRLERLEKELPLLRRRLADLESAFGAPPPEPAPPKAQADAPVEATAAKHETPPPLPPPSVLEVSPAVEVRPERKAEASQEQDARDFARAPRTAGRESSPPERPDDFHSWRRATSFVPDASPDLLQRFLAWSGFPRREDGGSFEARLGMWLATRIGGVFLVLFGVFFAVYVGAHSPAWVRFIELAATSFAVAAGGLWLERRERLVGQAVFASGLAMVYFTAFAAYAVPPVKVLDSQTAAVCLQLGAVLAVVAAGVFRRSEPLAVLAVALGLTTSVTSAVWALDGFAYGSAVGLLGATLAFEVRRGWRAPLAVATGGVYVTYAAMALRWAWEGSPPVFPVMLGLLLVPAALAFGVDLALLVLGRQDDSIGRRATLAAHSASAALLGFLVTWLLAPMVGAGEPWAAFYFTLGGFLIAWSLGYACARRRACAGWSYAAHLFFVKGSALIALGLIAQFEGRVRWLSLGAQAVVLLFSARRTRSRVVEGASLAAWGLASLFLLSDGIMNVRAEAAGRLWSAEGLLACAFLWGSGLFLSAHGRWMGRGEDGEARLDRAQLHQALVLALGGLTVACAFLWPWERFLPIQLLALSCGLLGVLWWGIPKRSALLAASIPVFAAHAVLLWGAGDKAGPDWVSWFVLSGVSVAALEFAARRFASCPYATEWSLCVHGLWVFELLRVAFTHCVPETTLLLAVAAALVCAVLAGARLLRAAPPPETAALPLVLGLFALWFLADSLGRFPAAGITRPGFLILSGAGAYGLAFMAAWWKGFRSACCPAQPSRVLEPIYVLIATAFGLERLYVLIATAFGLTAVLLFVQGWPPIPVRNGMSVLVNVYPASLPYWFMLLGAASVFAARWGRLRTALPASAAYSSAAVAAFALLCVDRWDGPSFPAALLLTAGTVLGIFLLGQAVTWRMFFPAWARGVLPIWETAHGGAGLVVVFALYASRPMPTFGWATAAWSLAALATFAVGLAGRSRPLRMLAGGGFAFAILRVFLVDAHSTFYRIVASGALGLLLLLVGWLYARCKNALDRWDKGEQTRS